MAKLEVTIQNLYNDNEKTFVFPADDYDEVLKEKDDFLQGHDWALIDIEVYGDFHEGIEKAIRSYLMDNFYFSELDELMEKLDELEDETSSPSWVVSLWNEYCQENSMYDDEIFEFDEDFLDNVCSDKMDAVCRCLFGNVNINDSYVTFNGYGNFITSNYPVSDWVECDDLVTWFMEER